MQVVHCSQERKKLLCCMCYHLGRLSKDSVLFFVCLRSCFPARNVDVRPRCVSAFTRICAVLSRLETCCHLLTRQLPRACHQLRLGTSHIVITGPWAVKTNRVLVGWAAPTVSTAQMPRAWCYVCQRNGDQDGSIETIIVLACLAAKGRILVSNLRRCRSWWWLTSHSVRKQENSGEKKVVSKTAQGKGSPRTQWVSKCHLFFVRSSRFVQ
jgi:hypothetical protein